MKCFPIIAILLIMADICSAQTQAGMNASAAKDFREADKQLNEVYQQILKDYKADTAFIRRLKISQRLWLQLRDAEMDMKFPARYTYGSVEPMCWSSYKTGLTIRRIKHLKEWADGIEEGDVCSGSVKLKQ